MSTVPPQALPLVEAFEGFSDHIYLDSVGVPTVGFGTTAADVSPLPQHLTRAQAEVLLARKLTEKYMPAVDALGVPLNPNQRSALVSLAYNCGPGIFAGTIGQDLRRHDFQAASAAFMLYVYAGGHVLQGLVNRRAAERRLFDTPWTSPDPHGYLKLDATVRHLAGRKISERQTCEEYDRKRAHWLKWPGRLKRLRENCGLLAARLEAVREGQGGKWHGDQNWRRDQLRLREHGRRIV